MNEDEKSNLFEELGYDCRKNKAWKEAISHLEKAIELNPTKEKIIWELGICHAAIKKNLIAAEYFLRFAQINNKDAAWYNCGVNYLKAGIFDQAAEAFKNALLVNPAHFISAVNYAHILTGLGQHEESVQILETCISNSSKPNAILYNNASYGWIVLQDLEKAEERVKQSMDIEKLDLNHMNYGHIYLIKGNEGKAIQEYVYGCLLINDFDRFLTMMVPDFEELRMESYGIKKQVYITALEKAVAICKSR